MGKDWSSDMTRLGAIYKMYTDEELGEIFGVNATAVKAKRVKMGLRRTEDYDIPEGHIRCSMCKLVLPSEMFGKNTSKANGHSSYCKECTKEYYISRSKLSQVKDTKEEDDRKQQIIDEYTKANIGKVFYCKGCNTYNKICEYYLRVEGKGKVVKRCIACTKRRAKDGALKRAVKKGY